MPTGNEPDLLRFLSSLGVGGAIAGLLFFFYRRDVRSYTELWKQMSEQLLHVVKENTAAFAQNTEVIKSLHRRLDHLERFERGEERRAPLNRHEDRGDRA